MNTVLRKVYDEETGDPIGVDMDDRLAQQMVESLAFNNTFVPNVRRVIYNASPAREGRNGETVPPTLATIVEFADGSRTCVKNSDKDPITMVEEEVRLSDGTVKKVVTASPEAREVGLVYAIAKRVMCPYDGSGFLSSIKSISKRSYNQDVEEAKACAEKEISKRRARENAEARARKNEGRAKDRRRERLLGGLTEYFNDLLSDDKFKSALKAVARETAENKRACRNAKRRRRA